MSWLAQAWIFLTVTAPNAIGRFFWSLFRGNPVEASENSVTLTGIIHGTTLSTLDGQHISLVLKPEGLALANRYEGQKVYVIGENMLGGGFRVTNIVPPRY